MKFPYVKVPTNDPRRKQIRRPIIPISLAKPAQAGFISKSIMIDALLDSGADKCLFHVELAKELGLNLEEGEREFFGGIEGGRIVTYIHKVQICVPDINGLAEVWAGFADAPGVFAILGQDGFFDAFRIKFERDRNIIEITLVD